MNQQIIIGTVGITLAGVVRAIINGKPATPYIIAGYSVGLIASIIDLAGGAASVVAGGIVMVAFVAVLINAVPWSILFMPFQSGNATPGGSSSGVNTPNVRKPF